MLLVGGVEWKEEGGKEGGERPHEVLRIRGIVWSVRYVQEQLASRFVLQPLY